MLRALQRLQRTHTIMAYLRFKLHMFLLYYLSGAYKNKVWVAKILNSSVHQIETVFFFMCKLKILLCRVELEKDIFVLKHGR